MSQALRLLLVEDSEDDALLILRELSRHGFTVAHDRVHSAVALATALNHGAWDIVITDHNMPSFNSKEVIAAVREQDSNLPVIIVSGSIGEDIAVAAMKGGAHDYIMKGNLRRLGPAIDRELRDAKTRRAHIQAQQTIEHMAYHDALTGLANRSEFERRLRNTLETTILGHRHALLYIDLDQFKIINDTCGHAAGDELLRQVAILLKVPVRNADLLARLGGDEFGALLLDCTFDQAHRIAECVLELIREFRFTWRDQNFSIGASIGLLMLDLPGQTYADVLGQVDIACYTAKDKGRNRIQVYQPDNLEIRKFHSEMEWVARINQALEQDLFEMHHQRIISLDGNHPVSWCEFLLRMREAEGGDLIPPGAFIPAAERYGMMPAIDQWVVKNSFAKLAACRTAGNSLGNGIAFVNLSGATLNDDNFQDHIKESLQRNKLPAKNVCFEITETAAISNMSHALSFIDAIKTMGCHVALDDFGTGLSSFYYLKTLPVDFLKIDGSFIRDILNDSMDEAIVEAVNSIGQVAGLKTIAEFVETDAILSRLTQIGVNYAQGFGIHKPEALNIHNH